jgi:miniconductance mechanosensitive channel
MTLKGEFLQQILNEALLRVGLNQTQVNLVNGAIDVILIIIIALLANWIAKKIIIKAIKSYVDHSKTDWDDILYEKGVFNRLSHLAPALVINALIYLPLKEFPGLVLFIQTLTSVYMVIVVTLVLISLSNALLDIYNTFEISKQRPIKGYIQMVQMIIYFIATLAVISVLFHVKVGTLLTGLGASVAVLMFVFKDTILGLVGSIQLSTNDMVRIGDWIEMPKHNADGTVIEMTLTTIKVRNSNNTITTVPTYSMVSDSFINWRGMTESNGRRIKRSFYIDVKSIKFCDKTMIEKFGKMNLLKDYVTAKELEINEYNKSKNIDESVLTNGRRMTNIGTFRAYLEAYLHNNENINKDLSLIVRQLQPTENGLPIEIYCFSKEKEFKLYEATQSDIFDHILAVIPEFELRLFQNPSGEDFSKIIAEK